MVTGLKFEHVVCLDDAVFVRTRTNSGRVRLFLLLNDGRALAHNGLVGRWDILGDYDSQALRYSIHHTEGLRSYQVSGSSEDIAG